MLHTFPQLTLRKKDRTEGKLSQTSTNCFIELKDSLYVDKTLLIRDIFLSSTDYIIFTRPQGWGKSLNLNMIKSFLQINRFAS